MHSLHPLRCVRSSFFTMAVVMTVGFGCSNAGSGCLTPYPMGTHYVGPKSDNAINMRLSAGGLNYLNSNWRLITDTLAPGGRVSIPVGCTQQSVPVVGNVIIADQGAAGCGGESCGRMDGQCDSRDVPANVSILITGFSLVPTAPDRLDAVVQLNIDTGELFVDTRDRNHGACAFLSPAKCAITFNTASSAPNENRLKATMRFSIDTRFDKLLAFSIDGISGTGICGASGVAGKPECLDPDDLNFAGRNNCGDVYCGVADWGPVKSTVLGLISGPLQQQVTDAVASQSCWPCTTDAECPATTDGTNAVSTCDTAKEQCMLGTKCVPRFLGLEGKMNVGALLGSLGAPSNAEMDVFVAAGATVVVNQGLSFGTRAGLRPTTISSCVPPQPAPTLSALTFPDFDAEAAAHSSGYHMGISVSSDFLNTAFWSAQQSGALCLNLGADNVSLLNSGLFKTFLYSLGMLATVDGKDAPMMVVMRPSVAPSVVVGEGTADPVTKRPIKPLLLISMPNFNVDFYVLLDDRQVRLFTLTVDIALPLSLIFEGCDKVTPALGDLKDVFKNIRTSNSEILAEDPQVLADLVPSVIGLAEPALADALQGITLPAVGGFKLKVTEAKGIGRIGSTEAFNHLGLFTQLLPANGMCAVSAPSLTASLKSSRIPKAEQMRLSGKPLPWPEAVLDVRTSGASGSAEFSYRVDNGLWTTFAPAVDSALVVSHPRFLLQGAHTISVRSRMAEDPQGISSPKEVAFLVDWEPPEVSLKVDRERDRVQVSARDVVSADRLLYAYRVGEGAPSNFGPPREISLSAIEQQGGVTVLVQDEYGLVGQATYAPSRAVKSQTPVTQVPTDEPASGCSTTGLTGAFALGLLMRSRRRRN